MVNTKKIYGRNAIYLQKSCKYMSNKYELDRSHLSKLIKGKIKKLKGWSLNENI